MAGPIHILPDRGLIAFGPSHLRIRRIYLGGVRRGAAVVLTDRGQLEEMSVEVMNALAEQGYESVGIDPFPAVVDVKDAARSDHLWRAVDAAVTELINRGWQRDQIAVIGFGYGGNAAIMSAISAEFGAVVAVCPETLPEIGSVIARSPLLVIVAGDDIAERALSVEHLAEDIAHRSPAFTEMVIFDGVSHRFLRGSRHGREHAAAFEAWQRTIESLNGHVAPEPTPLAAAWAKRCGTPATE